MRSRRRALLLAALGLVACGGEVAQESRSATDLGQDAGAGASVPSFGDAGPTMAIPVACTPCAANDACGGPQYACVASAGPAFCAPGCSKDGFCNPDQTCTWVEDPAGQRWRACLSGANPCGAGLDVPRVHGRVP